MRTFICLEVSPELRGAIADLQEQLRKFKADVSWTKPDNIHLTLKFLGEINPAIVNAISDELSAITPRFDSIELKGSATGVFPNPKRPKVLWVGLEGDVPRVVDLR